MLSNEPMQIRQFLDDLKQECIHTYGNIIKTAFAFNSISKQGSRCTSGTCPPAHKCQQGRTDFTDIDLARIFSFFNFSAYLYSVIEKV